MYRYVHYNKQLQNVETLLIFHTDALFVNLGVLPVVIFHICGDRVIYGAGELQDNKENR